MARGRATACGCSPAGGESEKEFIARCMKESGGDMPQDQRLAMCYSKWKDRGAAMAVVSDGDEAYPLAAARRFAKDAITVGRYVHPKHRWELDVTPESIDAFVRTFASMKKNGVRVPLVKDHVVNSDSTVGYVDEMYRDGDRLMFEATVEGDSEASTLRRIKQVSVFIEREFKDGKDNEYVDAITHVALTPSPVVPGQSDFVPIAASRGQASDGAPFMFLATRMETPMTREMMKAIRERLKIAKELTDETFVEDVGQHFDKLNDDRRKALEELKSLRAKQPKPIDEEELDERVESVTERVDSMVESGHIRPAEAASLLLALVGDDESPDEYMLSRVEQPNSAGRRPVRAHAILDVVERIKPVRLGSERTGRQFSRGADDDGGADECGGGKDVVSEMVNMAAGKPA